MPDAADLMSLYWTTAGIAPGAGEISPHDFKDRVESLASAGFHGTGLWHTDLEHVLVHHSLAEVGTILADNGMKHLELEFLVDWFIDGGRRAESDTRRKRLLEASAALGASHVKIGDFYNTPCEMSRVVDEFGSLCDEARSFGATIGFEFMAVSMLNSLEAALELVEAVNAPNGGLIVDIVQVNLLGIPLDRIAKIPERHLISVELNDGALEGSTLYDPKRMRRWCGEGDFDIAGFIRSVRETGYSKPWAVEVMSPELAALPLEQLAQTAFDTTARYLDVRGGSFCP